MWWSGCQGGCGQSTRGAMRGHLQVSGPSWPAASLAAVVGAEVRVVVAAEESAAADVAAPLI